MKLIQKQLLLETLIKSGTMMLMTLLLMHMAYILSLSFSLILFVGLMGFSFAGSNIYVCIGMWDKIQEVEE